MKKRRNAQGAQAVQGEGAMPKRLSVIRVNVDEIGAGMIAARGREEDSSLAVLAASIARHGLLQPVVVRASTQGGRYALVCGARRLLACRMLGMKQIDALLFDGSVQESAACFLEEHMTRRAPHFLDEAQMLSRAGAEGTQACCALPAGEITRRMRMLALDERTLAEIRRGALMLEQAEPLLMVPDGYRRQEAASIIAQRSLTPGQARRLIAPPVPEESRAVRTGKRRAIRGAMEAADRFAKQLSDQGIPAAVSIHSQERGLCIQILVKSPEGRGAEISAPLQEKAGN